jgi:dTDP-4-dehydrorhamnose 3,5-epimerase
MDPIIEIIEGVTVTPLRIINHPKGDIYHVLKSSEESFVEFGEAYFTSINKDEIKGWKKHINMVMNLVVPTGEVRFYFINEKSGNSSYIDVGLSNYVRLTVEPGIWMAFKGLYDDVNLVLNISNLVHEPNESINSNLDLFPIDKIKNK